MANGKSTSGINASNQSWKSVTFGEKQKLFALHQFLFVTKARSYNIEVQEATDGQCEVHAACTSDPNEAIPSVHGKTLQAGLQTMVKHLEERHK